MNFICESCKRARRTTSGHIVCTSYGTPQLAFQYSKCRLYVPKVKQPSINQKSLFDAMPGNEETAKQL